jgi:hypothetical protein
VGYKIKKKVEEINKSYEESKKEWLRKVCWSVRV